MPQTERTVRLHAFVGKGGEFLETQPPVEPSDSQKHNLSNRVDVVFVKTCALRELLSAKIAQLLLLLGETADGRDVAVSLTLAYLRGCCRQEPVRGRRDARQGPLHQVLAILANRTRDVLRPATPRPKDSLLAAHCRAASSEARCVLVGSVWRVPLPLPTSRSAGDPHLYSPPRAAPAAMTSASITRRGPCPRARPRLTPVPPARCPRSANSLPRCPLPILQVAGILAVNGDHEPMERLLDAGLAPVDILLLFAAHEGDTSYVRSSASPGRRSLLLPSLR